MPGSRGRVGQFLQHQQCVYEHIAFGMKLRRLLDAFHGSNFRKHFAQQAGFVEQFEGTPRMAFSQHAGEFITHAFAGNLMNLWREVLNGFKCSRINCVLESRREAHCAQHA